jgi:hypothetical protein
LALRNELIRCERSHYDAFLIGEADGCSAIPTKRRSGWSTPTSSTTVCSFLNVWREFETLRGHARLQDLARQVGIPSAQMAKGPSYVNGARPLCCAIQCSLTASTLILRAVRTFHHAHPRQTATAAPATAAYHPHVLTTGYTPCR